VKEPSEKQTGLQRWMNLFWRHQAIFKFLQNPWNLGKLQDRNITTVFSLQVTHGTRDTKQNQNVSQSVQQTLVNNLSL
jgi:hypothetical protein